MTRKDLCPFCKENMKVEWSKRCWECYKRGKGARLSYEKGRNKKMIPANGWIQPMGMTTVFIALLFWLRRIENDRM